MNEQPKIDTSMTGKLKRLASDILDINKPDLPSAATMPAAEPETALGGVGASFRSPDPISKQNATTGQLEPSGGDVAGFKRFEPYSLSVSVREAARGYGKKAGSGNRNLIYVDVEGWDQLAICRVSDREQWRPHERLEGLFHRLTPDYMLEFAYQPGRRAGKGGR
jgi:hypothetical protein